jgi:hypothetical protein
MAMAAYIATFISMCFLSQVAHAQNTTNDTTTTTTFVAPAGPVCFPGNAQVTVHSRGAVPVASLKADDEVLVQSAGGDLRFEPVLTFLHKVPQSLGLSHESLTVVHTHGSFRASRNHLIFVISDGGFRHDKTTGALQPGDLLLILDSEAAQVTKSMVLSISSQMTTEGMYAPLTSSGTLVVDGVVASAYGTPELGKKLPHAATHASFFAVRAYHWLAPCMRQKHPVESVQEFIHPIVKLMVNQLHLDKLLVTAA